MNINLTLALVIALALSLLGNAVMGWQLAGAKPKCEASKAVATVQADQAVRRDETKRDTKLDAVTVETQADTRKAVGEVLEDTRERSQAIERVVVRGDCVRPTGLPALDAAVDQANAAAGH